MPDKQQNKTKLHIDWCSYEAAKYAVMNWHYSKRMPNSKLAKLGVWEDDKFIGCVLFGVGATGDLVKRYGLEKNEGCELVRVALCKHITPVSRIMRIALTKLKNEMNGLRLIVSYADPEHGHVGCIYQAGNWVCDGRSASAEEYIVNGKRWHGRALRNGKPSHLTTKQYAEKLDKNFKIIMGSVKHRYLYPLDDDMRKRIEPLRKPYPKRTPDSGAVANNGRQCEPDPSAPIIPDEEAT